MPVTNISGIILAGGKSLRMGADKGLVRYRGRYLIEHAIDYMSDYCTEMVISTHNPAYRQFGYRCIPDIHRNIGPLGGIHAALKQINNTTALITACDIPEIDRQVLHQLCMCSDKYACVYLQDKDEIIQPLPLSLHGNLIDLLNGQINDGNLSIHEFIRKCAELPEIETKVIYINNPLKNINFAGDLNN